MYNNKKKKPTTFRSKINGEIVVCEDVTRDVEYIDGVAYYFVECKDHKRKFLMRKDALEKV
jgi:hypothetical protein